MSAKNDKMDMYTVKIKYKTKNNDSPKGKPKVYMTGHPADFNKYFDRFCDDIFAAKDCAIYSLKSENEPLNENEIRSFFSQTHLIVVIVTRKLLTEPNYVMQSEISYAKKNHIPILPFMVYSGLEEIYSQEDMFGNLQYISPFSCNKTEIPYSVKLKNYLQYTLFSDETVQRIRNCFDAYLFLSYRKKDRAYANELLGLFHQKPEFQSISVWYDEFLTLGENFKENIDKMLLNSELFLLLVTPNLLEEPDGKPNFVMQTEFPRAKELGVKIVPVEMEETDKNSLEQKFMDIPNCITPYEKQEFWDSLVKSLRHVAKSADDKDATHNFLIGLAYLYGIDMEVDRNRGFEFITSSAENNLYEAMSFLYNAYEYGLYCNVDYLSAVYWGNKILTYTVEHYGEESENTIAAYSNLSRTYRNLGDTQKELQFMEKTFELHGKVYGENSIETLKALSNLAMTYHEFRLCSKIIELDQRVEEICVDLFGHDRDTYALLPEISSGYICLDETVIIHLMNNLYLLFNYFLGKKHPDTVTASCLLAICYDHSFFSDKKISLKMHRKICTLLNRVFGEKSPSAMVELNNLAACCILNGHYKKAFDILQKAYELYCRNWGKLHPDTITVLSNIAVCYRGLKDYPNALTVQKRVCRYQKQILGENHPVTLKSLVRLGEYYSFVGKPQTGIRLVNKTYKQQCATLNEGNLDIEDTLYTLSRLYYDAGNQAKSEKLHKQAFVYSLQYSPD